MTQTPVVTYSPVARSQKAWRVQFIDRITGKLTEERFHAHETALIFARRIRDESESPSVMVQAGLFSGG